MKNSLVNRVYSKNSENDLFLRDANLISYIIQLKQASQSKRVFFSPSNNEQK